MGRIDDLITATVQDHGIVFPPDRLAAAVTEALTLPQLRGYHPDARGQLAAREAVANWYARRSFSIMPSDIILTPGTSLAYLLCLRLLCDRGDEILVPKPGYPLFDDLAAIAGVGLRSWHLRTGANGWEIDLDEIRFQITPRTRAIVLVSPHNPTGHMATAADLSGLATLCRERGLALIMDEVFCEWLGDGERLPRPEGLPLAIVLNGVSKMLALPQWKIAWLAATGDARRVAEFTRAAEHFSDALLAAGELQQALLPSLLEAEDVISSIAAEIARRRKALRAAVRLPLASEDRGVYVCASLPPGLSDEKEALRLIGEERLLVHPGYFYELPGKLVMTCVNPSAPRAVRSLV